MPAKDVFSQVGYIQVTESAANTLTFAGISLFSNILQQNGMLIERVEYQLGASVLGILDQDEDSYTFGLSGDDEITSAFLDDPQVYDFHQIRRHDAGTAANAKFFEMPIVADFTKMSGGGRLAPADRVYAFAQGANLSAAGTIHVRIFFRIIELSAGEYLELAQALRVLQ